MDGIEAGQSLFAAPPDFMGAQWAFIQPLLLPPARTGRPEPAAAASRCPPFPNPVSSALPPITARLARVKNEFSTSDRRKKDD